MLLLLSDSSAGAVGEALMYLYSITIMRAVRGRKVRKVEAVLLPQQLIHGARHW